jgi:anti-anti-sigma factor
MSPLAQLHLESIAGLSVARLLGEVDGSNTADLRGRLADAADGQPEGLVVDLTGLEFMDSTGIRMLFDLAASLRRQQQSLRVVVPDESYLAEILETVGLRRAAPTDQTVDAAVAAMRGAGGQSYDS